MIGIKKQTDWYLKMSKQIDKCILDIIFEKITKPKFVSVEYDGLKIKWISMPFDSINTINNQ